MYFSNSGGAEFFPEIYIFIQTLSRAIQVFPEEMTTSYLNSPAYPPKNELFLAIRSSLEFPVKYTNVKPQCLMASDFEKLSSHSKALQFFELNGVLEDSSLETLMFVSNTY